MARRGGKGVRRGGRSRRPAMGVGLGRRSRSKPRRWRNWLRDAAPGGEEEAVARLWDAEAQQIHDHLRWQMTSSTARRSNPVCSSHSATA